MPCEGKFVPVLSVNPPLDLCGEALAIGVLGVAFDLFQGLPSADGHDLVGRTPKVSQSRGRPLPQSMRRTLGQAGFIAPFSHPVAKPVGRKRLIEGSDDEDQIPGWVGINNPLKLIQYRNVDHGPGFYLPYSDPAVPYMLTSHTNHIATPLTLYGIRVIVFPFRAARWLTKWSIVSLICFMVGLNLGR